MPGRRLNDVADDTLEPALGSLRFAGRRKLPSEDGHRRFWCDGAFEGSVGLLRAPGAPVTPRCASCDSVQRRNDGPSDRCQLVRRIGSEPLALRGHLHQAYCDRLRHQENLQRVL